MFWAGEMPPCGVIDEILKPVEPDPVARFQFWLLMHTDVLNGPKLARKLVLDHCLPEPDHFVAVGELL